MVDSKWIKFKLVGEKPKTKIWFVTTKDTFTLLGQVKWFARWRKYAFFPEPDTVFEETCLRDILNFICEETIRHKEKRKKEELD